MRKKIDPNNIEQFKAMQESLSLQDAMQEADRCLLCHDAPCSQACPAGTDPGKFIRQIKFENYKGAARTIRNNNPLGAICSLVCPTEKLCEKNCSIKALEEPINIRGLQCFACTYGKENGLEPLPKPVITKSKVAIVGAGPAGISCAAELAKMGYAVTIFEKETAICGVAKWGIPSYRLSEELIAQDVQNLLDLGVNIKYNSPVEINEININKLIEEYRAVFIGVGLTVPSELPFLKGYANVINSTVFLRTARTERNKLKIKDKIVAVIGGGSVAMDAATTAAALGAKKVYAISLESLAELPADSEEIDIAHTMHIIFKPSSQITEVFANGNLITEIKGKEIEWIKPNDFTPNNVRQIAGTDFNLNVDVIIQAIGSQPSSELKQFTKLQKVVGKNIINVDNRYATNIPGVFAGGDIVNGGATLVKAVGEGKAAAQSINNYLTNLAK